MISKVLLVSAAAAGLLLAQPQIASAGVDVDVGIGVGSHYPDQYGYPDYPRYPSYHHDYDDDDDYDYDRISCPEGRRAVWRAGYRKVRTITCDGQFYRYSGWKRGHLWRVSVNSDSGRIVRARIIRSYQ